MAALGGLRGEKLALQRGHHPLFRDLSFEVSAGEVLLVEGPNGAGKTSLLRLIAGFLKPRAGSVALRTAGGLVLSEVEEWSPYIGWLGHQDGIKPQLTPHETLRFFARFHRGADVEQALNRLGLQRFRDLPVQYLSAGQKKRVALARLTLANRALWLMDEPMSMLDFAGRALVAELIVQHCRDGGMVVAATHEPLGIPGRHLSLAPL
ncbi:MAG TPA: heme ABC exporter ATP-binding protein CcmA [Rhizomicrobium sp.]